MRPLILSTASSPSGVARLSVVAVNTDVLRVSVHGELDLSNATWFVAVVADMMGPLPGRRVRIDLAGLRFMDAAGIRALLLCVQHATRLHGQAVLCDPQPIVHRLLEITGLLHLVSPFDADDRQVSASERIG